MTPEQEFFIDPTILAAVSKGFAFKKEERNGTVFLEISTKVGYGFDKIAVDPNGEASVIHASVPRNRDVAKFTKKIVAEWNKKHPKKKAMAGCPRCLYGDGHHHPECETGDWGYTGKPIVKSPSKKSASQLQREIDKALGK